MTPPANLCLQNFPQFSAPGLSGPEGFKIPLTDTLSLQGRHSCYLMDGQTSNIKLFCVEGMGENVPQDS